MTKNEININNEYFDWLCQIVDNRFHGKLLKRLHEIDFEYIIPMDGNRAEDGIELRYRFGYEHSYDQPLIARYLDNRPCSVLEMMIALALRCEGDIMSNGEAGDQTYIWFWGMIRSLGLDEETDKCYDEIYIDDVIDRFLKRQYKRNGQGGLFTIEHCEHDMRSVEIWYQMCWYMDTILWKERSV